MGQVLDLDFGGHKRTTYHVKTDTTTGDKKVAAGTKGERSLLLYRISGAVSTGKANVTWVFKFAEGGNDKTTVLTIDAAEAGHFDYFFNAAEISPGPAGDEHLFPVDIYHAVSATGTAGIISIETYEKSRDLNIAYY